MSEMSQPPCVPDSNLTAEQHEALAPLLKLASLGSGRDLVALHTPADQRRVNIKARFLAELREHGTITKAAAGAGIAPRTAQRWQNDDPEFAAEVERWKHVDQADELALTLHEIARRGLTDAKYANAAVRAGEVLLKALARDEFGDHLTTENTTTINTTIQVAVSVRDDLRARQDQRLTQLQARILDALPTQVKSDLALPSTKETP